MKRESKKDYQITPVRLPPEIRKKIRILAAENDKSMADMACELLAIGLTDYEDQIKVGTNTKEPA
jgi:plasmid stability protein